mmetsp:Transcript_69363/g.195642  ORF Transcript_69363/g.195642 Transcript_69363/m.195642 type:complete len:343 (-) Transcript_69363:1487-2515(-)
MPAKRNDTLGAICALVTPRPHRLHRVARIHSMLAQRSSTFGATCAATCAACIGVAGSAAGLAKVGEARAPTTVLSTHCRRKPSKTASSMLANGTAKSCTLVRACADASATAGWPQTARAHSMGLITAPGTCVARMRWGLSSKTKRSPFSALRCQRGISRTAQLGTGRHSTCTTPCISRRRSATVSPSANRGPASWTRSADTAATLCQSSGEKTPGRRWRDATAQASSTVSTLAGARQDSVRFRKPPAAIRTSSSTRSRPASSVTADATRPLLHTARASLRTMPVTTSFTLFCSSVLESSAKLCTPAASIAGTSARSITTQRAPHDVASRTSSTTLVMEPKNK